MLEQLIKKLDQKLKYAGKRLEPEEWIIRTLITSIAITFVFSLLIYYLYSLYVAILLGFFILITIFIVRYVMLEMEIEKRRREVERVLPDLLRVIAANISAGLTPLVALRAAARPEFGTVSKELKYLTARSMSAESFEDIIDEIKTRIRSDMLTQVLSTFSSSLRSGGNVINVLEESATDIQRLQELEESLVARTSMYTTFVMFGIIVTMPFLLAVSMNVLKLMGEISASQQLSYVSAYVNLGFPTLSETFINVVSILILVGSSLTASLLMGIIRTGKRIEGLRYFLPLMISSLLVFYLSRDFIVPFIIGILR